MNTLFSSSQVMTEAAFVGFERPHRRTALALFGLLAVVALAWQAITLMLTGGVQYWTSDPTVETHIAVDEVCLFLAALHAGRLRGQQDFKIAQAILGAVVIFGIYALLILGGRFFFSRPLLLSTACEAAILAPAVVLIRQKLTPQRIALIAPLTQAPSLAVPAEFVTDPEADLSGFDMLLVSFAGPVSSEWSRALARAMLRGIPVRHVGEYVEELRGAVSLDHFEYEHLRLHSLVSYRPFKRLMDIVLVIAAFPVAFLSLLVGMIAVVVGSGFPIFFAQDRIGLGGRTFRMWKLRTMTHVACAGDAMAALPGDKRVTAVGRLLRRFRIDEVPQLWNVLRGDMSVIGPRPEAVPLHDQYQRELQNYHYRYLVRPGITGWAQVNTTPSATTEEAKRKLTFDLFYVKNVSLYLDAQILLRTLWTITSGSGVR